MQPKYAYAQLSGRVFWALGIALLTVAVLLGVFAPPARAGQVWSNTTVAGDLTLQDGDSLIGTVGVGGTLTIPSGARVIVASTTLSVQAAHIVIAGTLDGTGHSAGTASPGVAAGAGTCAGGGGAGGAGAGGAGGSSSGPGGAGGVAVTGAAGSGGGKGGSCGSAEGGSGGGGGAAVHLTASDIRISGQVRVDGANGQGFLVDPSTGSGGGGGGGGSGGDLWLSGQTYLSGTLSALGGDGGAGGNNGSAAPAGGGGGGGGGGRIHIDGGSLIGEPGYRVQFGGGSWGAPGRGNSPAGGGIAGGDGVGPTVTPAAAPTANAGGPYTAYSGQTITLDGTKSADPYDLPLTYAWDFTGGAGSYADATTAKPSFAVDPAATIGTVYDVCVRVSDGFQVSAPSCSKVTVSPPSWPTAMISPATQTVENTGGWTTVTLDASGSQGNGGALTYTWSTPGGGSFSAPTGAVTTLTIPPLLNTSSGGVTASVTVDNGYHTATATTSIGIVDTTAPTLNLPDSVSTAATSDSGAPVSWTATATDAVWQTVTPVCTPSSGSTFPIGSTTVTCTATDGAGNTSSGSFDVTVFQTPATVSLAPVGDKTFGDPPFAVTATGTPGAGDITITASGACAVDSTVPPSGSGGTKTATVDVTSAGTCSLDASQGAGGGYTAGTAPTLTVPVAKATPQITWPAPAGITYGTALGPDQLDATTSWAGSWSYTADAGTSDATGQVLDAGAHTLTAVFTPADPADVDGATATVPLHVGPAATTLVSTSPTSVPLGGDLTPSALLTSSAAPCQVGQTVQFSLDRNPVTGVSGSYPLGSAVTDATGTATAPPVSTSSWQASAYTVTATYAGTPDCAGSTDATALTVTAQGQVAAGAGRDSVPGVGPVTFGFAVTRLPSTATSGYVGGISLVQDGAWSFQGVVNSYVKTTASSGRISGTGTLYWWNPALDHGHGAWALARRAVPFTASFTPTTRTSPGTFGAQLSYTPVSPQPAQLPNSAPIPLARGAIMLS